MTVSKYKTVVLAMLLMLSNARLYSKELALPLRSNSVIDAVNKRRLCLALEGADIDCRLNNVKMFVWNDTVVIVSQLDGNNGVVVKGSHGNYDVVWAQPKVTFQDSIALFIDADSIKSYISIPMSIWDERTSAWAVDALLIRFGEVGIELIQSLPRDAKPISQDKGRSPRALKPQYHSRREGQINTWQTKLPSNVGSGIGFASDGKLFFGNCQIYDPISRRVDSTRRYPKELCDPRRVKFSTLSPDGSLLLSSVTGTSPNSSGSSFRIDGSSGRVRSRSNGIFFTNIAIHPKNRRFARIESRNIKATERTTGDPEQYQVVAIRNLDRTLFAESPSMGTSRISSMQFLENGSSIEIDGRIYSASDWASKIGEESLFFENCSFDGSSCLRIQDDSAVSIHSTWHSQPIPIPDLFHQMAEKREFSWSQDGRFFAYKGIQRDESGASVMRMGIVELD